VHSPKKENQYSVVKEQGKQNLWTPLDMINTQVGVRLRTNMHRMTRNGFFGLNNNTLIYLQMQLFLQQATW